MIVIVVAKFGGGKCEARIRNGTGPRSTLIPNTPVCYGDSEHDVLNEAKRYLNPALVRSHRGVRVEVREDPFLTQ
ncbi:MAG TPA: hypothetical protein VJ553_03930 [Candidatus Paceibacterota bacterium]|nr:hypothetical protein [Candidatus Paceibacterota bacterium]